MQPGLKMLVVFYGLRKATVQPTSHQPQRQSEVDVLERESDGVLRSAKIGPVELSVAWRCSAAADSGIWLEIEIYKALLDEAVIIGVRTNPKPRNCIICK